MPRLAVEVGIPEISKNVCRKAYDDRSHGVHAGRLGVSGERDLKPALSRFRKLRRLLSAVERRCIEDGSYRELFTGDETIRRAWPVTVPSWFGLCRERI